MQSFVEIGIVILEKIFKFRQYCCYFEIISVWKRARASFESLEFPPPIDASFQVWLKLTQWFRRRKFLNVVDVFSLFRNYLPLKKNVDLYLNKFESPLLHLRILCAKFGWNLPIDSGEEDENVKSLQTDRQTDGLTENRRPEKLTWVK